MLSLTAARGRVSRAAAAAIAAATCLCLMVAGLVATALPARAADAVPIVVGTPTPVTIAARGDVASFTFTAPPGKSILVHGTDSTLPQGARVTLLDAAGERVGGNTVGGFWGPTQELGQTAGGAAQPYTLTVAAFGLATGAITIRLELVDPADGGSISAGVAKTLPLAVPGQVVDLTFAGTAGERPALAVAAAELAGESYDRGASARLLRPDGSVFSPFGPQVNQAPTYAEGQEPLDATGTWTLRVHPRNDTTGSLTFTLWLATDHTGTLTPGVEQTLEFEPGENARFTFSAVAGRRLTVEPLESTLRSDIFASTVPGYELRGPDGRSAALYPSYPGGFAETQVPLDAAGTWTLVIDPGSDMHGRFRFAVRQPADLTIQPSFTGPTEVAIGVQGQLAVLPFTASAGQRITLVESAATWTRVVNGEEHPGQVRYRLQHEGGAEAWLSSPDGGFMESGPLPESGAWRLTIDPEAETTGSATYRIRLGADLVTPIALGEATTVTLAPGETASYTFAGVAGRRPNVTVQSWGWNHENVRVPMRFVRPDGSVLGEYDTPYPHAGRPGFVEVAPLDVTGTWKLVIDPDRGVSGSERFVLRLPADVTQTVTSGRSQTLRLPTPGQNAVLSYTAAVGERPVVQVTSQRWTSAADGTGAVGVTFRGPDGGTVEERPVQLGTGSTQWVEGPVADVAGTWTATVDPVRDTVGRLTYTPRLVRDITRTLTPNTTPTTVSIGAAGQNARYTFHGEPDRRVGVDITRSAWRSRRHADAAVVVRVLGPDGQPIAPAVRVTASQGPVWVQPDVGERDQPLEAGTWTLELDPVDDTVGSATFTAYVRADQVQTVTPGTPAQVSITSKGTDAVLAVPVQGNAELAFSITGSTFPAIQFGGNGQVLRGEGHDLPPGDSSGQLGFTWDPGTRTYRVHPMAGATGSLTITFTETPF